jgi:hypothetical protein
MGLALNSFPVEAEVPDATINAACYFRDEPPSKQEIGNDIVNPLLEYERFSGILDLTSQRFHHHPRCVQFSPGDLVREIEIDGDEEWTQRTIFAHLQDPLKKPDMPWWEMLLVRNSGSGRSAVVIRVHHALADGLALVHFFQRILVTEQGQPPHMIAATTSTDNKTTNKSTSIRRHRNPIQTAIEWVKATIYVLALGMTKFDDDTVFSKCNHAAMKHTHKRDFLLLPAIPLEFIKALKTAATVQEGKSVTVNDILVTAISQAIHDYCQSQNDPLLKQKNAHQIQCRALLPVGFPRTAQELDDPTTAMRNKWCMVSCDIGVGYRDILDRLRHVLRSTTEIKETPRAYMQLQIQNIIPPLLPVKVARQTVMDVFSRHSLVLTNVPGPTHKCRLAGQVVESVQLFFENLLNQVDLVSYAGTVYGNIVYDPDALPEFQNFGLFYARALVTLAEHYQVPIPADVQVSIRGLE